MIGDAVPPFGARMAALPRLLTSRTRMLGWLASDANSGVETFDVRFRFAPYYGSTFGGFTAFRTGTTDPFGSFTASKGRTYCFSVRAKDFSDNLSAWGPERCMAIPVDDRSMTASPSWLKVTSSVLYEGTGLQGSTAGGTITLPVKYRRLSLLASTCSTCGTAKVYLGSTLLKTVNLYSATSRHKVLIPVDTSAAIKGGTIKIVQASQGKKVIIDGLAVSLV